MTADTLAMQANPQWYTLEDAAALLGKSTKTVIRLHDNGQLRSTFLPRPGKPPIRLYHLEDLQKIKESVAAKKSPPPEEGKTIDISPSPPPVVIRNTLLTTEHLLAFADVLAKRLNGQGVPLPLKLWLTLEEAQEYSGLPKSVLKGIRKTEGQSVAFFLGRTWMYNREALQKWTAEFTGAR